MLQSQSFSGIYPVHKERGETLAVLLERFRAEHSLGSETKLTYAGRLDPMAEGIVLVLAGESRFEKDALLGLPKTYEVEVLLGIATDTQDPLGLTIDTSPVEISEDSIKDIVSRMTSITTLPYPMYSSVPVAGKPLFVHARAGNSVEVPQKKVTISNVQLLDIRTVQVHEIVKAVLDDIKKVKGDFRQDDIAKSWELQKEGEVTLATIRVECSSGTYMRSLAAWMGEQLGVPALAYRIIRAKLGTYE